MKLSCIGASADGGDERFAYLRIEGPIDWLRINDDAGAVGSNNAWVKSHWVHNVT